MINYVNACQVVSKYRIDATIIRFEGIYIKMSLGHISALNL